jgi:hypothetical protein
MLNQLAVKSVKIMHSINGLVLPVKMASIGFPMVPDSSVQDYCMNVDNLSFLFFKVRIFSKQGNPKATIWVKAIE